MIVCDLFRTATAGLMAIPGIPLPALALTVGMLMAAVPLGMVIGAFPRAVLARWRR